jgi:hypothetical protein
VPADDEARWLVGETPSRSSITQTADANIARTIPHLTAVPTLKSDDVTEEPAVEASEVQESVSIDTEAEFIADDNVEEESVNNEAQHLADEDIDLIAKPTATLFDNQNSSKKSPSPSWDEILFGRAPENN